MRTDDAVSYFAGGFLGVASLWMTVFAVVLALYAKGPVNGHAFFETVVRPLGTITLVLASAGFGVMSYGVLTDTYQRDSSHSP